MPGEAEMFVFLPLTDNIVRCELTLVVTILLLYLIAVFGGFKEQQYQQHVPCGWEAVPSCRRDLSWLQLTR